MEVKSGIEKKFWEPSVTSQFAVCCIPFHMDTYRGCTYGCKYCLGGDTLILMADNSTKRLKDICVGDEIYGVDRRGLKYYYVKTTVLKKWETEKTSYKIIFENGENVICSGEHRWLSNRGWKYTLPNQFGKQNPFLTKKNYIRGFNSVMVDAIKYSFTDDYKKGYLFGVVRGDGNIGCYDYSGKRRLKDVHYRFRLAMEEKEAVQRARDYLQYFSIETDWFLFPAKERNKDETVYWGAIRTCTEENYNKIQELLIFEDKEEFYRGFLAGIYDAEGTSAISVKRLFNCNSLILSYIEKCLSFFNFEYKYDKTKTSCKSIRLLGGVSETLRFSQIMRPAISNKFDFSGVCLKNKGSKIKDIAVYKESDLLYDITTGTGNFIANGLISHNCFARDFIQFARRSKGQSQSYLVGNDVKRFEKWIERTLASEMNYKKAQVVAFKERMPLKIGATADPFPLCEREERITYGILKALQKIDYPTQISTKNPEVFLEYAKEFVGSNLAFTVSIPFLDDKDARAIECGAISITRRFAAIKKITALGIPVLARIHPTIYPYILDNAEGLIQKIKDSGCWGFMSEMLKVRVVLPKQEKEIYASIGEHFGFDILKYFKEEGKISGGDREYSDKAKYEVFAMFNELSKKYGLKYYNADNLIDKTVGCGSECCGTAMLHNYNVWQGNERTVCFDDCKNNGTVEFQKCICNFVRSRTNIDKTIGEVTALRLVKKAKGAEKSIFE